MRKFLESLGFEKVHLTFGWDDEEVWCLSHPELADGVTCFLSYDTVMYLISHRQDLPLIVASKDTVDVTRFLAALILERG